MRKHAWVVLLILSVICLSCSQVKEYVDIAKDETISKEYLNVLETWTRDKTVYSQFETRAHIVATYKSREFNEAYLAEYSRIYQLTESEREKKKEVQVELTSDFEEFLFYAYIPDKDSNDFSKADSIWKIFLIDEKGSKVYPLEVRKIEDVTPLVYELFPYIQRHYGMFYSLKFSPFPALSKPERLHLVFTSVLGRIDLEWDSAASSKKTPSS